MARTKGAKDKGPRTTSTVKSSEARIKAINGSSEPTFFADTYNKDGSSRKARKDANVRKNFSNCPKDLYVQIEQGKTFKL